MPETTAIVDFHRCAVLQASKRLARVGRHGRDYRPKNGPPGRSPRTGLMDSADIDAVTALARLVPAGGTVVDVGSLLGMSASLWCLHSKAARIVCIDLWRYEPWMESFAANNGGEISKAVFLRNVPDDRIEAVQGHSPACVSGWWTDAVDLYWDDSDHSNPGFLRNLDYWTQHVKPGGIVSGHDYHWKVVRDETEALAVEWGTKVERLGTAVWWIRKPVDAPAERPWRLPWWVRGIPDSVRRQSKRAKAFASRFI